MTTPPSLTTRLDALCRQHGLAASQAGQLRCLLEVLASDPHAPTSVTRPEAAVDVHIADSLAALEIDQVRTAMSIADLGAGAGFPGLALAVALPRARVALVESAARKCAFMERARSAGGLGNAVVVNARAEAWADGLQAQDVVTARAVAPLAVLCEYAAPLLRIGGILVAWRGGRDRSQEAAADRACAELGLEPRATIRCRPYPGSVGHHLHVYSKVRPTPERYPRRTGIASKRPLGVSG